jgi:uncharacterized protein YciI
MAIRELQPETLTLQVKRKRAGDGQWLLVTDGTGVLKLAGPKTNATVAAGRTALVGSREELEAEIARRKLTPHREYHRQRVEQHRKKREARE